MKIRFSLILSTIVLVLLSATAYGQMLTPGHKPDVTVRPAATISEQIARCRQLVNHVYRAQSGQQRDEALS